MKKPIKCDICKTIHFDGICPKQGQDFIDFFNNMINKDK